MRRVLFLVVSAIIALGTRGTSGTGTASTPGTLGTQGTLGPLSSDWTHYAGNAASQKYSPLDQINKDTVAKLKVAWRWTSPDNAVVAANPLSRPGMYHDTPLMVKGVLYTVTSLGQIAAINPATGESLWVFDPANWKAGRPGNLGFVHRGISYWSEPSTTLGPGPSTVGPSGAKERLLLGTSDAYLISVDAKTGALDTSFGQGGRVDLMEDSLTPYAARTIP